MQWDGLLLYIHAKKWCIIWKVQCIAIYDDDGSIFSFDVVLLIERTVIDVHIPVWYRQFWLFLSTHKDTAELHLRELKHIKWILITFWVAFHGMSKRERKKTILRFSEKKICGLHPLLMLNHHPLVLRPLNKTRFQTIIAARVPLMAHTTSGLFYCYFYEGLLVVLVYYWFTGLDIFRARNCEREWRVVFSVV